MVQPNTDNLGTTAIPVDLFDSTENSIIFFSALSEFIQRKTAQREYDTRERLDAPDTKPFSYLHILPFFYPF